EMYDKISGVSDSVSYSYKTNPAVAKILYKTDSFFSINSYNTFKEIIKEVSNEKIIYFLQGEKRDKLKELVNKLDWFVVDNENDLNKLLEISKELDKEINLYIRIKIKEHTIYTGKYFVYGISWMKANDIISNLDKSYIDKLGIHFHRKTQNVAEWDLKEDIHDALERDTLRQIDFLNIGGGVPYKYINSKPKLNYIFKKIKEFKEYLNQKNIKLVIEPGRFIAAPSLKLKAEILNIYEGNVILDCSIFNSYMDTYLMHMRLPIESEKDDGKFVYLIKGSSPDSLDIFRYKARFEKELKIGDKLIFNNAGAYNFHTEFGNMDKVETNFIDSF
ncbi:MAG: decarboxylase, partial [Candidatus Woesearchaeota archaeon]